MSSQSKFFIQKNIDPKEGNISGITAVNITDKYLITGNGEGILTTYEFGQDKLTKIQDCKFNSKIEKILVPPNRKYVFVFAGNDVYVVQIPLMKDPSSIYKKEKEKEQVIGAFLNKDDPNYQNMILILIMLKKKRVFKLYHYDILNDGVKLQEKKIPFIALDADPKCGLWTLRNYFVYFAYPDNKKGMNIWINLDDPQSKKSIEIDEIFDICCLGDKVAVSTLNLTLFMIDGFSYQYNPISHQPLEFKKFCEFKNNLCALYSTNIRVYKAGKQEYEPVDFLSFNSSETAKFIVASKYKLIAVTESNGKYHFIDFQEKSFEEQISILLDQKLYDNALEKLIGTLQNDDIKRQEKIESLYLDIAWTCLDGNKKDYDNCFKYLSLTNFNPFEFIYMFFQTLNLNIIHIDKAADINGRRAGNQLITSNTTTEEEQKKAFKFLVSILKIKRDYILEKIVKPNKSEDIETKKIKFESSKRSKNKIYLGDSTTETTIMDVFYAINSTLIKSLIKLKSDPKEIEDVLDNESVNISKFEDIEKDQFFIDNKDSDEAKFALSYIIEKKGNNYEIPLKQWEEFGKSDNEKYSLIGKELTKKIFYNFKDNKDIDRNVKGELFTKYINWLLEKYQREAFEVVVKTELISHKIFLENTIPEFTRNRPEYKTEDLKEKFLEYCNENQKNTNIQTQLLQLYADKMFKMAKQDTKDVKIEGDLKKYYDSFMNIIESEDSVYNKKAILEYIEKSWLIKPKVYLYTQLNEHDKSLKELFNLAKISGKYKEIEDFCQKIAYTNPEIYQDLYKLLSQEVRENQEKIDKNLEIIAEKKIKIEKNPSFLLSEKTEIEMEIKKIEEENKSLEQWKEPFEKEMLNLLEQHGKIDEIDPIKALELANEHWNVCDKNNEFFNYLMNIIKEYTYNGNKYKLAKNFSEVGLIYKEIESYDFKKKYVTIDSDKSCDLCKKKIGSTIFVVYPNLKVYHSKCAPNPNIDPVTGVDFSKKKYVE